MFSGGSFELKNVNSLLKSGTFDILFLFPESKKQTNNMIDPYKGFKLELVVVSWGFTVPTFPLLPTLSSGSLWLKELRSYIFEYCYLFLFFLFSGKWVGGMIEILRLNDSKS